MLPRRRCARLNLRLPLETRVGDLGVADQQMVEIARAILSDARLIIMDEPTSALASEEVQRLFSDHPPASQPRDRRDLHQPFSRRTGSDRGPDDDDPRWADDYDDGEG